MGSIYTCMSCTYVAACVLIPGNHSCMQLHGDEIQLPYNSTLYNYVLSLASYIILHIDSCLTEELRK